MSEEKLSLGPDFAAEFLAELDHRVKTYGQALQGVVPGQTCSCCDEIIDDAEEPFIYTVGNHGRNLPELLIVGFFDPVLTQVLNNLGSIQRKRGKAFEPGELVDFGAQFPAKIGRTGPDVREKYTNLITRYYNSEEYSVLQVLLCDPQGRYPGEPNCDGLAKKQPVLFSARSLN